MLRRAFLPALRLLLAFAILLAPLLLAAVVP
jgi:hypothetical protein